VPLLTTLANIPRASLPLPWLITAGQPSAEQFRDALAAGVTLVIDIRDPMEPRPFDEAALVGSLGMRYINIPVVAGDLSNDLMDQLLAAMRSGDGKPTILHCASANRVGGPLIAYLMLDKGIAEQDAVQAAMRAGLRSAEIMEWGVGYAKKNVR
jgi:protein tyrosine phosphatase (PTP) superfamily phosphohydrolase (DUF442 family)